MARAQRNQFLDVLGIKTGRIVDVFDFEATKLMVKSKHVDFIVQDDTDKLHHINPILLFI